MVSKLAGNMHFAGRFCAATARKLATHFSHMRTMDEHKIQHSHAWQEDYRSLRRLADCSRGTDWMIRRKFDVNEPKGSIWMIMPGDAQMKMSVIHKKSVASRMLSLDWVVAARGQIESAVALTVGYASTVQSRKPTDWFVDFFVFDFGRFRLNSIIYNYRDWKYIYLAQL